MNRVELSGRLTRDVEIKKSTNNTSCGVFALAVNEYARTVNGKAEYETSFINCVIFGAKCDGFAKNHRKGDYAVITGKIHQRTYLNKQNQNVSAVEVIVEDFDYVPKERKNNPNSTQLYPTNTQPQGEAVVLDDLGNDDLPF